MKSLRQVLAGRRRHGFAAFSSHAYPAPADFADAKVMPDRAYFDPKLGEFLLPNDVGDNRLTRK